MQRSFASTNGKEDVNITKDSNDINLTKESKSNEKLNAQKIYKKRRFRLYMVFYLASFITFYGATKIQNLICNFNILHFQFDYLKNIT